MKRILEWIAADGMAHILVCWALTLTFGAFMPVLWAAVLSALIGVGKEVYDRLSGKGSPTWHDLICDLIGVGMGVIVLIIGGLA